MLNETQTKWSSIISEELGVTDKSKLSWMSQYAQIHEIKEGTQSGNAITGGIYTTPLNTLGMGNPMMPQGVGFAQGSGIGNTGADFHNVNYKAGSGDIPMSTLNMSLEIAAMTIGLELVPVIPSNGPWAMLSYMDFPYAGGKLGAINETAMDGKGAGADNKPIFIKFNATLTAAQRAAIKAYTIADRKAVVITNNETTAKVLNGEFLGLSRIDGNIIIKVTGCGANKNDETYSIADVFAKPIASVKVGDTTITYSTPEMERPELVTGAADHIQGFANFYGDGNGGMSPNPMTRAQNETGVGNTIGARMFSKMVQMGAFEVTGSVTRQQLQDMPLYGVDVIGKILESMQNQISQEINNRILDRVAKLGVTNAVNQYKYQGVNLNLYLAGAGAAAEKAVSDFTCAKYYVGIDDANKAAEMGTVKNAIQNTAAENITTHQRRIMSRILAAANLIANVSRRGRAQWVVTNTAILSALQDAANYVVAPMTNNLAQDGSQSLYFAGSLAGLSMYCDPYMLWDDTRCIVGRKSNGNDPGVIFMPYILADTVQITAEGTMAPKLLCNSRFALVDAGFYPEQSYYTFMIEADGGLII